MNNEITKLGKLANHFDTLITPLQNGSYQKISLVFRIGDFETIKPQLLANAVQRSFNTFENDIFSSLLPRFNRFMKSNWKINFPRIVFRPKSARFVDANLVNVITLMPKELVKGLEVSYENELSYSSSQALAMSDIHGSLHHDVIDQSTFEYMQDININAYEDGLKFNLEDFSMRHSHLDYGQNKKFYLESKPRVDSHFFHQLLKNNLEKPDESSFFQKYLSFKIQLDDMLLEQVISDF